MLDLFDPKPDEPEEAGRPSLRLVPKGPRVRFTWIEYPELPWPARALAVTAAIILTTAAVLAILFTAGMLKEYYDRVDALDLARAEARARENAIREASRPRKDGAIVLSLPQGSAKPATPPHRP